MSIPGEAAELLQWLRPRERRGSKPRCHALTHGNRDEVARRLTSLILPFGCVTPSDRWMPVGFDAPDEARLHRASLIIPSQSDRKALRDWWLAEPRPTSSTPSWDIAATCSIDGKPGLLLVEAKAHAAELTNECVGKRLADGSSKANDRSIRSAIAEANDGLQRATGCEWHLSADRCYQMSNRFAWAWKLCTLGYSVALVYLGFPGASEMAASFRDAAEWRKLVEAHSALLFSAENWEHNIEFNGATLHPLIRTVSGLL